MNLYGYEFQRESDLTHYGVIGMKWGVRRYQDANGKLTAEGRRHLKREAKIDNQIAYDLGRKATLSGKALVKEEKKLAKKDNISKKEQSILDNLKEREAKDRKAAEDHYNKLVEKYGKDFVSHIRKTKFGTIKEKTTNYKDFLKAAAVVGLLTIPISAVAGGAIGIATAGEAALSNALLGINLASAPLIGKTLATTLGADVIRRAGIGAVSAAVLNSTANAASYKSKKDNKESKQIRKSAKKKRSN